MPSRSDLISLGALRAPLPSRSVADGPINVILDDGLLSWRPRLLRNVWEQAVRIGLDQDPGWDRGMFVLRLAPAFRSPRKLRSGQEDPGTEEDLVHVFRQAIELAPVSVFMSPVERVKPYTDDELDDLPGDGVERPANAVQNPPLGMDLLLHCEGAFLFNAAWSRLSDADRVQLCGLRAWIPNVRTILRWNDRPVFRFSWAPTTDRVSGLPLPWKREWNGARDDRAEPLDHFTAGSIYHAAILDGRDQQMRMIISSGLDPNQRDGAGNPPLHLAQSPEMVQALLEVGCDPMLTSPDGVTVWMSWLHQASVSQGKPALDKARAMIDVLEKAGFRDPSVPSASGGDSAPDPSILRVVVSTSRGVRAILGGIREEGLSVDDRVEGVSAVQWVLSHMSGEVPANPVTGVRPIPWKASAALLGMLRETKPDLAVRGADPAQDLLRVEAMGRLRILSSLLRFSGEGRSGILLSAPEIKRLASVGEAAALRCMDPKARNSGGDPFALDEIRRINRILRDDLDAGGLVACGVLDPSSRWSRLLVVRILVGLLDPCWDRGSQGNQLVGNSSSSSASLPSLRIGDMTDRQRREAVGMCWETVRRMDDPDMSRAFLAHAAGVVHGEDLPEDAILECIGLLGPWLRHEEPSWPALFSDQEDQDQRLVQRKRYSSPHLPVNWSPDDSALSQMELLAGWFASVAPRVPPAVMRKIVNEFPDVGALSVENHAMGLPSDTPAAVMDEMAFAPLRNLVQQCQISLGVHGSVRPAKENPALGGFVAGRSPLR